MKPIKNRQVWGPSGEVGIIVKTPGHGKIVQSKIEDVKQKNLEDSRNKAEREQIKHFEYLRDFWVSSDKHSLNSRIERFVDLGMKSYESDLEHKKNKLKVMMLHEQSDLTQEYVDKAQKSADMIFETKLNKAKEIESKAADAEKSFVQKAYARVFQDGCDELRTKISRENRMALKEIHEKQICDRKVAERLAREEDKFWATVDNELDDCNWMKCRDEASAKAQRMKDYAEGLDRQMEEIKQTRLNEKCVERIEESARQEYQKIKNEELQLREVEANWERESQAKQLIEQLEANRLWKEMNKKEQMHFDRIMIEDDRKRAEQEQSAVVDNRAQLRCELTIFRESLKQYNDSLAAHEKDMEVIIEEFKKEHELKQLAVKQKSARARRDLLNSCLDVRKQQVADQQALKQKTKDSDRNEAEYVRFRQAQSEALDITKNQREFKTSQEAFNVLRECEKYESVKRGRERLEMEKFNEERLRKNEEIEEKTEELLSRPVKTIGTGIHPFLGPLLEAENIPQGGL
ncbi:hypothetical protein GE061_004354 [Apolygus lucorum]|uniref:Trichohyalin-plectin-homology domain-containing protein n=1 Tax=Apolygus lucorum TaxID=248454 RepID=A0A8S9X0R6_APOLU|nr:hypothetical protein GE061_004354 [Apolygus lucorum]